MSLKHWTLGLFVALLSGLFDGLIMFGVSDTFSKEIANNPQFLKILGTFALISGVKSASLYLKQSPLPKVE